MLGVGMTNDAVVAAGRFLRVGRRGGAHAQVDVVLNWFEELKTRVPVP